MKVVGQELERWALGQTNADDKDLFARSAFNRYYYAVFLITREMIGEFEAGWRRTNHAGMPDLLRGAVKRKVETALKDAVRGGLMSQGDSLKIKAKNAVAINALAVLLQEAYHVRVVADYEPEIVVQQKHNVISLDTHKLASAKTWPDRAASYCKCIRKVWEEVGLA